MALEFAVQRQSHGLAAIPGVNVAPAVPVPRLRVILPRVERLVFIRQHDVAESQGDDLALGIPPSELSRQGLAHQLRQRVCRLGSSLMLFGHRQEVWHVRIEGNTNECLRGGEDDVFYLQLAAC